MLWKIMAFLLPSRASGENFGGAGASIIMGAQREKRESERGEDKMTAYNFNSNADNDRRRREEEEDAARRRRQQDDDNNSLLNPLNPLSPLSPLSPLNPISPFSIWNP